MSAASMLRRRFRGFWLSGVTVALSFSAGCAHLERIDDGQLLNGVHADATPIPNGVDHLRPNETAAVYEAQGVPVGVMAWPEWRTKVGFYHLSATEKNTPKPHNALAEGDVSPGDQCDQHAQIAVTKLVEYDGRLSPDIQINVTNMSAEQRAHIPITFHFTLTNTTCGYAPKVVLVDSLPPGFTPTSVEIEDRNQPPAWEWVVLSFTVIGWIGPLATWHRATVDFDDIAWDVKQVDGHSVLIVSADTHSHPLEMSNHIDLRVTGTASVPGPHL